MVSCIKEYVSGVPMTGSQGGNRPCPLLLSPLSSLAMLCSRAQISPVGEAGQPGFRGNKLSLPEIISHLQFWGPQLSPYVGCLWLHDPSHINVIIRASIYTGSERQLLVLYFIFPAWLAWDILPF